MVGPGAVGPSQQLYTARSSSIVSKQPTAKAQPLRPKRDHTQACDARELLDVLGQQRQIVMEGSQSERSMGTPRRSK